MEVKTSGPNAGLYQAIIDSYLETGSVLRTSRALSISEVKVRRVLLTEGLWSSRTSLQVQHYYNQNMTAAQIAQLLHTTEKAVQQYMPYERGMYKKEDRTADAGHSAIYRERMRSAKERTLKKAVRIAEEAGWKLMAHTFDLHHDPSMSEGNVMTEYEEKFSSMGNPIYKLIAGR